MSCFLIIKRYETFIDDADILDDQLGYLSKMEFWFLWDEFRVVDLENSQCIRCSSKSKWGAKYQFRSSMKAVSQ